MKKLFTGIIIAVAVSVFVISFFIGRATALRDSAEKNNDSTNQDIYTGTVPIPRDDKESIDTSNNVSDIPAETEEINTGVDDEVVIPYRMIFPCGETVQKEYSQTAVFSETMGDWRAHTGIDYAAALETKVLCVWDGIVSNVYRDKLWGFCVEVSHGNNLKSVYKNLDEEIIVKKGDKLISGQVIGKVGNSADIESLEAPHLHFEMWQDEVTINPISYVY